MQVFPKKIPIFLLLLVIVLTGFFLRVWQVAQNPTILNRDEAALAYNAFLLQQTGKDEWGKSWPLALESFGDYKLIGYPLFVIGSFFLFGHTDFAVRLPSVLGGTALIVLIYFFIRRVLKKDEILALIGAGVIAFQPVFFFFSRMAFEANVALSLFVAAVLLLLWEAPKGKNADKLRFFKDLLAVALCLLAVFTYNTPLLLLPFLGLVLLYQRGWKNFKNWLPAALGLLLVFVLGWASLFSLSKQKSGITIFSDESIWKQSVDYHLQFHGLEQKILGNKVVFFGQIIAKNYWNTLGPSFLVIRGGAHPWHQLPGFGHFFWSTYLLGLIGIGAVIWRAVRIKKKNPLQISLLYLLVVAPLPAVVTVDAPHATRSLFFFFMFVIFMVIGVESILEVSKTFFKKNQQLGKCVLLGIGCIFLLESTQYFVTYFQKYPQESTAILHGNFEKFIQNIDAKYSDQKIAIIDDAGFQYVLVAWYLKMPPAQFFATVDKHLPDRIGFRYGYKVKNYRFIVSPNDRFPDEKVLVSWNADQSHWDVNTLY